MFNLGFANRKKLVPQANGYLTPLLKRYWISLVITACLSGSLLSLPGFFFLFKHQFNQLIGKPNEQQQFTVFLDYQIEDSKIRTILTQIEKIPTVGHTKFIDQDLALEEMQQIEGINLSLNILKTNPLLHSIVVTPKQRLLFNAIEELKMNLLDIEFVRDVRVDEEWATAMGIITLKTDRFLTIFNYIITFIIATLIFYFMLVKNMTSRLEIKLKIQFGAYPWQIYGPYFIFGLITGILSGIIATIILSLTHIIYTDIWVQTGMNQLTQESVQLPATLLLNVLMSGSFIGSITSFIATFMVIRNIDSEYFFQQQ